jgi:type III secretion protein W
MEYKALRSHINYETVAKLFFDLADERYPSSDKIKQQAARIVDVITRDPYENIHLKIAVLSMMRNMIKEVSPAQIYRSIQHRDDLHAAIIQALEDLEDTLEEFYEKQAAEESED